MIRNDQDGEHGPNRLLYGEAIGINGKRMFVCPKYS